GVLVAEGLHLVAGLAERGAGGGTGEAGADDDRADLAPVGGVDEAGTELALTPAALDRDGGRCLGVGDRGALAVEAVDELVGHGMHYSAGLDEPEGDGERRDEEADDDEDR